MIGAIWIEGGDLYEFVFGYKAETVSRPRHSTFIPKADIHQRGLHVRLVPEQTLEHQAQSLLVGSPN